MFKNNVLKGFKQINWKAYNLKTYDLSKLNKMFLNKSFSNRLDSFSVEEKNTASIYETNMKFEQAPENIISVRICYSFWEV
jgi:hypothetical protein